MENTLKYAKTLEQIEKLAKPVRLHLMGKDNLKAQVNQETIKKISTKDSVFSAPSLEFYTVLKILQKSDHLTQKEWSWIVIANMTCQETEPNQTLNESVKPDNNKKK